MPEPSDATAIGAAFLADLEAGRIEPEDVPLEAVRQSEGFIVIGGHDLGRPMAIVGDYLRTEDLPPDLVPYDVRELAALICGDVGRDALGIVHQVKHLFGGTVTEVRELPPDEGPSP